MKTIFEKQGVEYQQAGDYMLANVGVSEQKEYQIGVWANRHRHYLKHHYRKGNTVYGEINILHGLYFCVQFIA